VGVFVGEFMRREPERFAHSIERLGRWFREGKLRPHVSRTLPLDRAAHALAELAARRVAGKIVLTT
jgi:NADPH2:quinone reductase